MIKPLARLGAAAGAVSSAIWLVPATVGIASWRADGPSRVAYLSPLSSLWLTLAVVTAVVTAGTLVSLRRGRSLDGFSRLLTPLSLLWLWVVPFVPWLPDRAPTLLLFAGPLRWIVAALALGGVAGAARWPTPGTVARIQASRVLFDPRLLFAVAFATYALLGVRFAREAGFNGDEPHYLVIAHSLLTDRDLDISNNHERRDYNRFFSGTLRPDFLRRGTHEEIYSIHAFGLPVVLLPAYALAGAIGTVIGVALLAALASIAMFKVAERLAGPRVALATWATISFSVPWVPHAWLIYPETAAAVIVACAVVRLWQPSESIARAALYGALVAVLPWLHTKFVVLLALFAVLEAIRLWPRVRNLIAFLAPIGVLSGLWLLSFYWMYGVFDPQAPYGSSVDTLVLARNIPRGLLGLVFDQKFGLLIYAPLYVLALPGAWFLLREDEHRFRAAAAILIVTFFVLSTTRFYMWWGGSSAPARFLVPIVPLLVPFIAAAFARLDDSYGRALVAVTVIATMFVACLTLWSPTERLLYSAPHGLSLLLGAIQGAAPMDVLLPTFTEADWTAPLAALAKWITAVVIAGAGVFALVRARLIVSSYWIAVSVVVAFLACAAITDSRPSPAVRAAAATEGQVALLHAYDPTRFHPVDASQGTRLDDAATRSRITLDIPILADQGVVPPAPVQVPEGKYEAQVWFAGPMSAVGEVHIVTPDGAILGSVAGALANPAAIPFEMPVSGAVTVRATGMPAGTSPQRVQISAVSLVPRSARLLDRTVAIEPVDDGHTHGLLAYADAFSYPEHGVYWTRGTDRATTAIVARDATGLKLILHVGPTGGFVEVTAGGKAMDVDLQPNETRELTVELGSRPSRTLVSVRATKAFVPADSDTNNSDRRSLGCQVRPVLF